jgi:hypothetical protein
MEEQRKLICHTLVITGKVLSSQVICRSVGMGEKRIGIAQDLYVLIPAADSCPTQAPCSTLFGTAC